MTDRRQRQPASDEAPHSVPENPAVLAPPRQRAMPIPTDSESKHRQRRLVLGHSVVAKVSTHNRPQPLALLGDGFVHASLKLGFHLIQLRLQPLAYRLPQHREPSIALLLYADVRKAEKVERLRLPFSTPLPLVDRMRTELQQSRFLGMQLQMELLHAFREFHPELIGIRLAVKSNHDVVRKTHPDHVAVRPLLTPRLDPQVEHVMEINVSQQRRGTAALGRPFFHPYSFPILQHTGVEPFLDQSHDAPIGNPVLAGRSCLPAPLLRAAFAAHRPTVYRPYAPAWLGTLLVSAYGKGPGDCPRGSRRSAATSLRRRPAPLPSSS